MKPIRLYTLLTVTEALFRYSPRIDRMGVGIACVVNHACWRKRLNYRVIKYDGGPRMGVRAATEDAVIGWLVNEINRPGSTHRRHNYPDILSEETGLPMESKLKGVRLSLRRTAALSEHPAQLEFNKGTPE